MTEPVRLAVDLGTTHTVAVVRRGEQQPRALLFDGSPLLSSGVMVDAAGTVHTGRDGQRLGAAEPHRFEPHPKRRIDDGSVLLGEYEVPVVRLLAASLGRVAEEARVAGVEPAGATVLTCPADWGQPRRDLLRAAAGQAGLGQVWLLDEPIAAATYCVQVLGQQVPPGWCLGVFDFGGGTLDVAVVRREPDGLRVLATGGLDDLGGLDVDEALVAHLGQLVGVRDPGLWQRLEQPADGAQRRDRQAFWTEVRAAKEMLSRASTAPVQVPGRDEPMHLTRDELERVAGPLVARAVDETRRVLQRAGVPQAALAGLLLVGGASRMPLVASRLHARLGIAPSVPEQPELPVAFGALVHATAPVAGPPATGYRVGAAPVTGYPAPPRPGPPGPLPTPVSPVPSGGAVATTLPPVTPSPQGAAPGGRRRRAISTPKAVLRVLATGILVIGAILGARLVVNALGDTPFSGDGRNNGAGDGGHGGAGELTKVHDVALTRPGAAGVTVAGDQVVYAVTGNKTTQVVSLPGGGGTPKWQVDLPIEPSEVRLTPVADLILVDGDGSTRDGGKDVRAVVSAADGKLLWKRAWEDRTDVAYYGTDVVVEQRIAFDENKVLRVDLRTGHERWSRQGPQDLLTVDAHRIEAVRQWPDQATAAKAGALPAVEGALHDVFTAAPDAVVELNADDGKGYVVNPANGKAKVSGALPLKDEMWTAFDGAVIGLLSNDVAPGHDVLAAYSLSRLKQVWKVELTPGFRVERVKPCGQHLVCAAVDGQNKTLAIDSRTGKQVWSRDVESSDEETWYVGPNALVFGDAPFDTISDALVLGPDGHEIDGLPESATVEAALDGRIVMQVSSLRGNDVAFEVCVGEMGSDQATSKVEVGSEPPGTVTLGGDLVGVLTRDRRVLALRVAR